MAKRIAPVHVTALGGVGEVGKNSTLLECDNNLVLIDCGVQFPSPEQLGVDLIIPDFSYVLQRPEQFLGLVLTHAHEDHIGAVPFFLRQMGTRVDIYGTDLTLAMVEAKLKRHGGAAQFARFHPVAPDGHLELGPFRLEFVPVGHSIPDAIALRSTRRPAGSSSPATSSSRPRTGELDRAPLREIGEQGCWRSSRTACGSRPPAGRRRRASSSRRSTGSSQRRPVG